MAGVILELEGAAPQPRVSPVLAWVLPIASAVVAAATLYAVAGSHHPPTRAISIRSSSILQEAFTQQTLVAQTLELRLPDDVAAEIHTRNVDGVTGLGRSTPTLRSFRLRGTNTVVIIAKIPGSPAIVPPADASDALVVHGTYAADCSIEEMSLAAVRWTENGMTYEVSSHSLLFRDLVTLAEQVR